MAKRNFISITDLKGITAECSCGGTMNILKYGKHYWGVCQTCQTETTRYHSAFAVKNEQHKHLLRLQPVS